MDQPINNGIPDSGNNYAYVVAVAYANSGAMFCSGTLVTPRWVMTARHCVDGDGGASSDTDLAIFFGYDLSGPAATHTYSTSGPVVTLGEVGEDSTDIALIRLDAPVPFNVTRPKHPSLDGACGNDWYGRIVGYGGSLEVFCEDPPDTRRRWGDNTSWERIQEADGSDSLRRLRLRPRRSLGGRGAGTAIQRVRVGARGLDLEPFHARYRATH